MADSTVSDVTKMKVVDLRKELKSRGLVSTGDKAELVARLQAAMAQDASDLHGDINLDSDEIDSDGVLDEDDKSHNDILDDTDTLNEEEALADHPPPEPSPPPKPAEIKPMRTLKRKITIGENDKDKAADAKTGNKESGGKKIVLNRAISITSNAQPEPEEDAEKIDKDPEPESNISSESNKVKITADVDLKTRLELRAKRFGLPVKMTDDQRKEARKERFGQNTSITVPSSAPVGENMDKLKKRAERFGQSVSKFMTDVENRDKLEKRKAKFGMVK